MNKIDLELIVATASDKPDGTSDKNLIRMKITSQDGQVHVESQPVLESGPARVIDNQISGYVPYDSLPAGKEILCLPPPRDTYSHHQPNYQRSSQPRDSRGRFVSSNQSFEEPRYRYAEPKQYPLEDIGLRQDLHEVDKLAMNLDMMEDIKKKDPDYDKGRMPRYPIYLALGAVALAALAFAGERVYSMRDRDMQGPAEADNPSSAIPSEHHEHYNCSGESYAQVSRKLTGRPDFAAQIKTYNTENNPYFDSDSRRCKGTIYLPPGLPIKHQKQSAWTRHKFVNGRRR